jgi:hypothetical protein
LHELGHGADRLGQRNLGIDPVQVVQVDHVEAEAGQRRLAVAPDVAGAAVHPHARLVADDAELGGHLDPIGPAGQRAGDQPLVMSLAVAHRGVEQRHAQVERPVNDPDRVVVVGRAVALGQPHAPQADR